MARTKASLGEGARLSDFLSASLLARVFPAEEVVACLDKYGRNSQRLRSFPAVAGVYYCMALSLYPEAAYEEVFAAVVQGLAWAEGAEAAPRVAKSSISALRSRIGSEPLAELMGRGCRPLADEHIHPAAFYRGLRLVAMDGSNFEVPDEADNARSFGYPGSRTGQAGYPQAQCAVLIECATHAILDANIGAYREAEWALCAPLLRSLHPGMLCLADRGFSGFEHWRQARASGSHLLWRCVANRQLPIKQMLADGSYLSEIYPSERHKRRGEGGMTVRVIEYALAGIPDAQPRYRLLSSLTDPQQAPALELAALYHERWQVEAVFDELKTHLRQSRRVLRSKTADLVRQEFYGWVLAHYAVRWLMHEASQRHRLRHDTLSFTRHVHLVRREQPRSGAFPPRAPARMAVLVRSAARHGR
ncbi:MAG TPA: IS4 family transposase [Burkholderiales bacterium]|nr:IS4 family transposase [Burkholderiales bacterium]